MFLGEASDLIQLKETKKKKAKKPASYEIAIQFFFLHILNIFFKREFSIFSNEHLRESFRYSQMNI